MVKHIKKRPEYASIGCRCSSNFSRFKTAKKFGYILILLEMRKIKRPNLSIKETENYKE